MKPTELLEKLPANEYEKAVEVLEEILRGGPRTVRQVVEAVGEEFGDPDGVKPKYAVHGLALYSSRPGAESQRKLVAGTLAKLLDSDHSDEFKAFICRQLQLCGRPEEVPALARMLVSDRLCEPATQALTAIGGKKAVAALRAALPSATGKRRATLINALGRFGEKAAASEVRRDVDAEDPDLRIVAWYALGNMGDSASIIALSKAAGGEPSYERTQATDACLRLARALGEAGKSSQAEMVCRRLMSMRRGAEDVHDRCAVLETLAAVSGARAVRDVMSALGSKELRLRHPAARTAVDLARAIRKDRPRDAERLLNKVLEATQEEAVRIEAQVLLAEAGN